MGLDQRLQISRIRIQTQESHEILRRQYNSELVHEVFPSHQLHDLAAHLLCHEIMARHHLNILDLRNDVVDSFVFGSELALDELKVGVQFVD